MTVYALTFLISLDVAYELVAHFYFRNGRFRTISFVIRSWERHRLLRKVIVSLAVLGLWAHLVLEWF